MKKNEKERMEINKIINEQEDIPTGTMEIQRTIRTILWSKEPYYEQLHYNCWPT